jgi:magnesium-transporting ATPase (P-type)
MIETLPQMRVAFSIVVIVLCVLIVSVFIFYIYHNETLVIIALLLLVLLAVSLRVIRAIDLLFRPRRPQSQQVTRGFFPMPRREHRFWDGILR